MKSIKSAGKENEYRQPQPEKIKNRLKLNINSLSKSKYSIWNLAFCQ